MADAAPDANRIISPVRAEDDADAHLRPQRLKDFIGQRVLRENLAVFIAAARERKVEANAQGSAE